MQTPANTSLDEKRSTPDFRDFTYLIIAGTTKAGTGSLFYYLDDHPQVCCSNIKETRFFYNDENYPLPASYTLADGAANYQAYFSHCRGEPVRVEATPDYLYSPDTPRRIQDTLPDARLVFLLRDPIERVVSWYRFGKQQGLLPASLSFTEYVTVQFQNEKSGERSRKQSWRTLEQGRYSRYLQPYLDAYGQQNLLVIPFEAFKLNPLALLTRVSEFAGIDPEYYNAYAFEVHHKTMDMRNSQVHRFYVDFRRTVRLRVHDKYYLWKTMRRLRRSLEPLYLKFNTRQGEQVVIEAELMARLKAYYADEREKLSELLRQAQSTWLTPQPEQAGTRSAQ